MVSRAIVLCWAIAIGAAAHGHTYVMHMSPAGNAANAGESRAVACAILGGGVAGIDDGRRVQGQCDVRVRIAPGTYVNHAIKFTRWPHDAREGGAALFADIGGRYAGDVAYNSTVCVCLVNRDFNLVRSNHLVRGDNDGIAECTADHNTVPGSTGGRGHGQYLWQGRDHDDVVNNRLSVISGVPIKARDHRTYSHIGRKRLIQTESCAYADAHEGEVCHIWGTGFCDNYLAGACGRGYPPIWTVTDWPYNDAAQGPGCPKADDPHVPPCGHRLRTSGNMSMNPPSCV